jgi:hypothetical protein
VNRKRAVTGAVLERREYGERPTVFGLEFSYGFWAWFPSAISMEAVMAAEKFEFKETFWFGTVALKTIVNENKNGIIYNSHLKIDYNKEYESYGFLDYKDHIKSNQNVFNAVVKVDDEKPLHFHFNVNQWEVLA